MLILGRLQSSSKYSLRIQPVPKRKQYFTIKKINWLTLFEEMITIYSENRKKCIYAVCGKIKFLIIKAYVTYSYHCGLNG
jgi:hypothetical protein